jgi:hypothetical protein
MQLLRTLTAAAALTVGVALPAFAYIGPGAGLSLLGAFWGLLLAVGAALGFVILWPLRRMFKRDRTREPRDLPAEPTPGVARARSRSA